MHCLVFRMEGKGMMERNDSQKFLVACCVSLIGGAGGLQSGCAVIIVVIVIVILIFIAILSSLSSFSLQVPSQGRRGDLQKR